MPGAAMAAAGSRAWDDGDGAELERECDGGDWRDVGWEMDGDTGRRAVGGGETPSWDAIVAADAAAHLGHVFGTLTNRAKPAAVVAVLRTPSTAHENNDKLPLPWMRAVALSDPGNAIPVFSDAALLSGWVGASADPTPLLRYGVSIVGPDPTAPAVRHGLGHGLAQPTPSASHIAQAIASVVAIARAPAPMQSPPPPPDSSSSSSGIPPASQAATQAAATAAADVPSTQRSAAHPPLAKRR
jgi:hypothetical protein